MIVWTLIIKRAKNGLRRGMLARGTKHDLERIERARANIAINYAKGRPNSAQRGCAPNDAERPCSFQQYKAAELRCYDVQPLQCRQHRDRRREGAVAVHQCKVT
jgi:Fe-S-cluster containining protein